jgi:putative solute:sodium symporter small subunit
MDESSNDYHISFFKPTTPQAKANRNMVVWLVLIWFIAIFGFQTLLRVIQKPTPEPAFLSFQNVWEHVEEGSGTAEELQEFGKATLSVLGKKLTPEARNFLNNGISWTVYQLTADSLKPVLISNVQDFETTQSEILNITDPDYVGEKQALSVEYGALLNLPPSDIRWKLLPLGLISSQMERLAPETIENIPGIMEQYLIHNQSFLTDSKFLGFPFHYFYTAIFLLIMFVGLCWIYCVRTDRIYEKLNVID